MGCSAVARGTGIFGIRSDISDCHVRVVGQWPAVSGIGIVTNFSGTVSGCTVDVTGSTALSSFAFRGESDTLFTRCTGRSNIIGFSLGPGCVANGCISGAPNNSIDPSVQTNLSNF